MNGELKEFITCMVITFCPFGVVLLVHLVAALVNG